MPPGASVEDIVSRIGAMPGAVGAPSVLRQSAMAFGNRPEGAEATMPTGFDPAASALFEAFVEAAFLVASADGEVDADERALLERVVVAACGEIVTATRVDALMSRLAKQVKAEGLDARLDVIAQATSRPDHAKEILRVAVIMGGVTEGVSASERGVLNKLAEKLHLEPETLENVLRAAE